MRLSLGSGSRKQRRCIKDPDSKCVRSGSRHESELNGSPLGYALRWRVWKSIDVVKHGLAKLSTQIFGRSAARFGLARIDTSIEAMPKFLAD